MAYSHFLPPHIDTIACFIMYTSLLYSSLTVRIEQAIKSLKYKNDATTFIRILVFAKLKHFGWKR